jgi:Protein of unknown function (DUF4031)
VDVGGKGRMTVYVGVPMWPFRNMMMCHMFADTEEELDEMAKKLGLRQSWKQGKDYSRVGRLVHYDIAKSKRAQAIGLGAIALDDLEAEADKLDEVIENAS